VSPDTLREAEELRAQLHAEIGLAGTRIAHIRASANANAFELLLARLRAESV